MKKIVLFILLFSAIGFGQGVRYSTQVQDISGRRVAFPVVRFCSEVATGIICTPLALGGIFSDIGLTQPLANPFTGDQQGNIAFYVAPGRYHAQISGNGIVPFDIPDIPLVDVTQNTGSGLYVLQTSPTINTPIINSPTINSAVLVTPNIGVATGTSLNLSGNLVVGGTASITTITGAGLTVSPGLTASSTLNVVGLSTLANVTLGAGNTLTVVNIKQIANTAFVLADPLGLSHLFISASSPYTNTFINGNGAGVVFLGSGAKTSVADTTGNIVTAGNIALQNTSQLLPATVTNSGDGSISVTDNATHLWKFNNADGVFIDTGNGIKYQGSTSGAILVKAPATAGSNTLTLPAATGTVVCDTCTQTLTNKTATTLAITGGGTNRSLVFNASAQIINGNTTDDLTTFSTNTDKLQVQVGVSQGSGHKHQRFGATNATAAAAGSTSVTTYTWTSAFADANYTVSCTGNTQSNTPGGVTVESKTAANFVVRITAISAAAAAFAGVDCVADHD